MLLSIILITAGVAGLVYGIVKKNKVLVISSAIILVFVLTLLLVYSYLYSQNPY